MPAGNTSRQQREAGQDQRVRMIPFPSGAGLDGGPDPRPGPGSALLALARDLTRRLADRAQPARPAASEPVTGPELGAWLRAQRQARGWAAREMARRLIAAGRAAGDTSIPSLDTMCRNIRRWEHGPNTITERYKMHYCRALGIHPTQFGPAQHPALPAALAALLTRWLEPPAAPGPGAQDGPPAPPVPAAGRPSELDALRAAWGDLYDITATAARLRARRRDGTGPALAADTTAQLNTAIRADWATASRPDPAPAPP
jgi:transcriptional regulator with XRE-family HTH domain